jgi:hypothetical protein
MAVDIQIDERESESEREELEDAERELYAELEAAEACETFTENGDSIL